MEDPDQRRLGPKEYYKCPLPHTYPRHEQAFFKDFDAHFKAFKNRDDHFALVKLHEQLSWEYRRSESEKHILREDEVRRISLRSWLETIKRETGQSIKVITKK